MDELSPVPSPLKRKRIVVTRATAQGDGLCNLLSAHGAEPISFPLIKILPVDDFAPLDVALAKLQPGDWITFTSQNAVNPVLRRARILNAEFFRDSGVHVAAVGPVTAFALRHAGVEVAYSAVMHDGVSLARELGERVRGRLVLLPRSDIANADLPDAMMELGAEVLPVVAYRTEQHECRGELAVMVAGRTVDAVICFSPSAVQSLMALIDPAKIPALNENVVFAAIGETTAQAFREAGVMGPLVAAEATPEAVVDVLQQHFEQRTTGHGKSRGAKKS